MSERALPYWPSCAPQTHHLTKPKLRASAWHSKKPCAALKKRPSSAAGMIVSQHLAIWSMLTTLAMCRR